MTDDAPIIPTSQDNVAKTIGSTLWKWYEELRTTVGTNPNSNTKKKYSSHQIPPSLDRFEENLRKEKNDMWLS